jgi:transcriptional regulator with XRE-family HTH domain
MEEKFDASAFYAALDAVRDARHLSWKQVAEQSGVNASTLTRIGKGKRPDVDGLAALLVWSSLKAEMFIESSDKNSPEPIAQITTLIRMDRSLSFSNARLMEDIVTSTYNRLKLEK